MKTGRFLVTIFLLFVLCSVSFSQTYNFTDGINVAKSLNRKIIVEIFSDNDNWSKKMESEVYSSAKVQSALSDFVFIKLNAESKDKQSYNKKEYTSSELAKSFGATGYPTFVFMNPDGSLIKFKYNSEEVSNLSGFIGESDFIEMLGFFLQNKYKDTDLSTVFQN